VWRRRFGGAVDAPPVDAPPVDAPPVDAPPVDAQPLPAALQELAAELDAVGFVGRATLCRRAADALASLAAPVAPTVRVDAANAVDTAYDMLTAMVDDARRAAAVGNYTAASKAMAAASKLLNDVERLRARTTGDDDMIHVSRRDLAEAERILEERERVTLASPMLCERCGADVRVAWAEERDV
jgi:hypothetical protein